MTKIALKARINESTKVQNPLRMEHSLMCAFTRYTDMIRTYVHVLVLKLIMCNEKVVHVLQAGL